MDFFLGRKEQAELRDKLRTVPALAEELAITTTRQARVQKSGLANPRRAKKAESKLPFHMESARRTDELQNCLSTWVRLVCEQRAINYEGHSDIATLASWLDRNMIPLALTEGSEDAADDIGYHIGRCWEVVDLPPDDEIVIDRARVEQANRQVLTAGQVEKIAPRLGPIGEGLNKRRVETLVRWGVLRPCALDGDVRFFRLGDVLDAHHRAKSDRRRKAG